VGDNIRLELFGRTEVGQVREHNEDSFLVLRLDDASRNVAELKHHELGARGTLLVVCDGMGGAAAGEVASSMAVESIAVTMLSDEVAPPPPGLVDDQKTALARKLRQAAREANLQIFREARDNATRSGMGTTMTAAIIRDRHALVAQVGDSRCYVWRQGNFTQVTRDQSLVNQLLESGHITPEQAKFFEHSNVILQALGVQEEVEVQLSQVELRRGDRLMLCSDGLVGVVTDEEIGAVLGAVDDPEEASRALCDMANAAGGPDNITCIVARVEGEAVPEPSAEELIHYQLWKIEPDPPAPDSFDEPTVDTRAPHLDEADTDPAPRGRRSTTELVSMAVVVGLVIGSVATGAAIYRQAVPCRLAAATAGLAVLADGRDSGARTVEGTIQLRLRPGHHTLALRGPGAPAEVHEVEVTQGGECTLGFASASADPTR
jgi:protein phosphatase